MFYRCEVALSRKCVLAQEIRLGSPDRFSSGDETKVRMGWKKTTPPSSTPQIPYTQCMILYIFESPVQKENCHIVYCDFITTVQRVIFVGGNFREKLDKAPRIKFCGFKFRGTMGGNMNFNL